MTIADDPHFYAHLREHIGHTVVCVCYARPDQVPDNIAIECEDCGIVLVDVDFPQPASQS